mmetsp:Transcript_84326/g.272988  ORF Transcript_84326/g.272988 Transcript_84326/m.272988 type:complete len:292 (+) Transcript_84326:159-1034(+)
MCDEPLRVPLDLREENLEPAHVPVHGVQRGLGRLLCFRGLRLQLLVQLCRPFHGLGDVRACGCCGGGAPDLRVLWWPGSALQVRAWGRAVLDLAGPAPAAEAEAKAPPPLFLALGLPRAAAGRGSLAPGGRRLRRHCRCTSEHRRGGRDGCDTSAAIRVAGCSKLGWLSRSRPAAAARRFRLLAWLRRACTALGPGVARPWARGLHRPLQVRCHWALPNGRHRRGLSCSVVAIPFPRITHPGLPRHGHERAVHGLGKVRKGLQVHGVHAAEGVLGGLGVATPHLAALPQAV